MKLAMIVIRPDMYYETSKALIDNGFFSMTSMSGTGRGKQRVDFVTAENEDVVDSDYHQMVAKKIIEICVRDEQVDELIEIITQVNSKNHSGDGKIFIIPVESGQRLRTGETGDESIM